MHNASVIRINKLKDRAAFVPQCGGGAFRFCCRYISLKKELYIRYRACVRRRRRRRRSRDNCKSALSIIYSIAIVAAGSERDPPPFVERNGIMDKDAEEYMVVYKLTSPSCGLVFRCILYIARELF